jgi:flagellar biosynthesis anti-sigma factor FlgM
MRINSNRPDPRRSTRASGAGGTKDSAGGGTDAAGGGEGAAHLNLNLPNLRAKLESLPEVRMGRVEALQDAIDRGEYEVDGEAVVSHLLRNVLLDNLK